MKRRRQSGSAMLEMTLVGIPLIFILISAFEVSRGMWMYHTLAYAVREGVRYASVHGPDCGQTNNTCLVNQGPATTPPTVLPNQFEPIAQVIQDAGVGLDPDKTQLRFCPPNACTGSSWDCALSNCPATPWPTGMAGTTIRIDITVPFRSAIAMFWPGAGYSLMGVVNFVASSSDVVQF